MGQDTDFSQEEETTTHVCFLLCPSPHTLVGAPLGFCHRTLWPYRVSPALGMMTSDIHFMMLIPFRGKEEEVGPSCSFSPRGAGLARGSFGPRGGCWPWRRRVQPSLARSLACGLSLWLMAGLCWGCEHHLVYTRWPSDSFLPPGHALVIPAAWQHFLCIIFFYSLI